MILKKYGGNKWHLCIATNSNKNSMAASVLYSEDHLLALRG
jgi:hypothetical protein